MFLLSAPVAQSVEPGGAGNQGEQQQLNKPMRVQCIGATLARRNCRQEQVMESCPTKKKN